MLKARWTQLVLYVVGSLFLFQVANVAVSKEAYAANDVAPMTYVSDGSYIANSFAEISGIVFGVMNNRYGSRATVVLKGSTAGIETKLQDVFKQIVMKDDYMRFVVKKINWTWTTTGSGVIIRYEMQYWETAKESDYVAQTAKQEVSALVKPDMKEVEKEKAIHDWIISKLSYDETLDNHSAYAGLTSSTVCQGYALLGYKMFEAAGMESRIVYGDYNGQSHVWNLVKVDGTWYHVDFTLDDVDSETRQYKYFNLTDAQISSDHRWTRADYPASINKK